MVVLDLGMGEGNTAMTLALMVRRVVAVDIDEEIVEKCRSAICLRLLDDRIDVRPYDAMLPLPFAEASIDIVTCRAALHHFNNAEGVLEEAVRVLRPGGTFQPHGPLLLGVCAGRVDEDRQKAGN